MIHFQLLHFQPLLSLYFQPPNFFHILLNLPFLLRLIPAQPFLFLTLLTLNMYSRRIYRDDRGPEYSIFVGDLGPEVNEYVLVSLFQSRFPSCKSAKIMTDAMSGQSRGYGFVRFTDESDQQRALVEMQGVYCGNRPMRISTATPKNRYVSFICIF
jgi:RNA recognition motif. (a.k.a. RRM, RBD, or RNP domain)